MRLAARSACWPWTSFIQYDHMSLRLLIERALGWRHPERASEMKAEAHWLSSPEERAAHMIPIELQGCRRLSIPSGRRTCAVRSRKVNLIAYDVPQRARIIHAMETPRGLSVMDVLRVRALNGPLLPNSAPLAAVYYSATLSPVRDGKHCIRCTRLTATGYSRPGRQLRACIDRVVTDRLQCRNVAAAGLHGTHSYKKLKSIKAQHSNISLVEARAGIGIHA